MKFAGYSLAVSFIENHCRLSVGISRKKLHKSRFFSAYTQNKPSHGKSVMVAKYYLPPGLGGYRASVFVHLPICLCIVDAIVQELLVGHGYFGVRLMLDPKFVAEAMSVIAANTNVPVTVKCRIGVDDHDSYNELCDFIYKVSSMSPSTGEASSHGWSLFCEEVGKVDMFGTVPVS
ncbi:tRNA-dihydrouridine(20/20a) synthase-like isoform X3 [Senna tora]|uniref:tRNA-dihydrouridine(20/20a) synthase-like isoform X3 n=1 Tax=Senna tora TaxID=362788 RepID=A0A834SQS4_9FABA|nr:tRNA-dihydrouridine(20/20a) synthase-like isoform X3 [Senna tora]